MTGIIEMFAELSEPDFYDVSAQLELFVWRRKEYARGIDRDRRLSRRRYFLNWQRMDRARKAKEGVLCSRCSAVRVDGKASCQRHLDWDRERYTRRKAARAA